MDTNAVLKRFMMERQILAQLQHPNIANLVDGGTTTDGLPYFVMEYVEGLPVQSSATSMSSPSTNASPCLEISARSFHTRTKTWWSIDLKPSNIIVTDDGTPKLLDFGIAKPASGLVAGYERSDRNNVSRDDAEYASPEQLSGQPITTASDVYSLGVVLYELLCGRRPIKIEGRLPDEAANIVSTEEPPKPSSGDRRAFGCGTEYEKATRPETIAKPAVPNSKSLRGDVDNIILKALAKEPEPLSIRSGIFRDIRRHLEGLPVTATADSLSYRFAKFTKRHRTGVIAGGVIILTLLAATAVTSWQASSQDANAIRQTAFQSGPKLAHTVLFDYHDGIAELAGSTRYAKRWSRMPSSISTISRVKAGDADLQRSLLRRTRRSATFKEIHIWQILEIRTALRAIARDWRYSKPCRRRRVKSQSRVTHLGQLMKRSAISCGHGVRAPIRRPVIAGRLRSTKI
jgi:hypothetical protein